MGDSLDDMIALRKLRKEERRACNDANDAEADKRGWTALSEHHYRRHLAIGGYIDWWPRTKKWRHCRSGTAWGKTRWASLDAYLKKHNLVWAKTGEIQ